MEKKTNSNFKETGRKEEKTGGKAARVKRMRKGNAKTSDFREAGSDALYSERNVK